MCDVCEEAANTVAAQYGGTIDPEEVRKIVRAFREESERILERDAAPADAPDIEHAEDAPGFAEFLDALGVQVAEVSLVPLGARPYVLIEAEAVGEPQDGLTSVMVTAVCGGGITNEGAVEVMGKALEQVRAAQG